MLLKELERLGTPVKYVDSCSNETKCVACHMRYKTAQITQSRSETLNTKTTAVNFHLMTSETRRDEDLMVGLDAQQ